MWAVHESARDTIPDINALNRDVCFASINGYREPDLSRPKSATNGLVHTSKSRCYSIISSARASSAGGRVRPSAFAVFRLIRSWNLVA
jgi:hypothetical protein